MLVRAWTARRAIDLSDLQQLAARSLLVQEDDGETWALLFFRGNGQERSGVPRIIQLTEQGAPPLRALDGNVEFSNGISLCASEFEYGPEHHFVLNYSTTMGKHLAFIDLSQPEAQLLLTIDAAEGENFSCPAHSIDGTRVSFVRSTAAESTIVTVDWTTTLGDPAEVYSSEKRLAVHAQL